MTSIHLNEILDFSDDVIREKIKNSLDIGQFTWLEEVLRKKTWNPIPEFTQYINQFTEVNAPELKFQQLFTSHVLSEDLILAITRHMILPSKY